MGEFVAASAEVAEVPETSRAVHFEEFGDPEVLKVVDVSTPKPGRGEVLVRVKACAINGFELMIRKGTYTPYETLPHVCGGDVSGVIGEYGPECRADIEVGTPVMLHHVISCGECEPCLRGHVTTCLDYGYLGAKYEGGYADYIVVPERNLVPIPDGISFEKAAAFPLGYGTAWHQVFSRGGLQAGDWFLVMAAGSGIGSAAVQMGRIAGAHIIATAGSDEKCDKALEMGADHAINYSTHDILDEVRRITSKRGVDIVFEHVGGPNFERVLRCVTRNGRLVTCGGVAGYDITFNVAHVFHKQLSIIGSNSGSKAEMLDMLPFLKDGSLDPIIDSVTSLADVVDAHRRLEERKAFGKVVLDVDL